jgi:hypothetical protein
VSSATWVATRASPRKLADELDLLQRPPRRAAVHHAEAADRAAAAILQRRAEEGDAVAPAVRLPALRAGVLDDERPAAARDPRGELVQARVPAGVRGAGRARDDRVLAVDERDRGDHRAQRLRRPPRQPVERGGGVVVEHGRGLAGAGLGLGPTWFWLHTRIIRHPRDAVGAAAHKFSAPRRRGAPALPSRV